ncbi:MAG: hypothetical protein R6U68_09965 [Desulfobacteraceae bacterium]
MNTQIKSLLSLLMITALGFGFLQIYLPLEKYNYERLHIFLFNLCTGGTILLHYTRGGREMSKTIGFFLGASLVYAFSAFFNVYPVTLITSLILIVIVEKIRIEKFSFVPLLFFKSDRDVSEKFHMASLLCLSTGLGIAALVIVNNEYIKVLTLNHLTLNTFFLGFSFPISLVTLSAVFSMLTHIKTAYAVLIKEICFWTINLGVIVFFIFILMEKFVLQIFVTIALFAAVALVFYLYIKFAHQIQQKLFLTSGIGFLMFTAVTGIAYIFIHMAPGYVPEKTKWLMHLHVFASLYGWNLCGLAVICRAKDFPIQLHSRALIIIHWLTAVALAPVGIFYPVSAIAAVAGYSFITITLFFSRNQTPETTEA